MIMYLLLISFIIQSCTINMIQTDTHGVAEDVVDSDPSTTANPDVSIPVTY